jgi:serine/threonine-protein kinase
MTDPDDIATAVETPGKADATSPGARSGKAEISGPGARSGTITRVGSTMTPQTEHGRSIATSVVMQSEEVLRARAFYRLTTVLVVAGTAFMFVVPGPAWVRVFASVCCLFAAAVGLFALRALRRDEGYTPRLVTFVGVAFGVAAELALFYFGLFTAAAMVLPLGVYFFGLSESRTAARVTYWTGAIVYFVLSMGVLAGVLPDLGPMPIGSLPLPWRAFFIVMTQVVFAITYFFATSSRRATEVALAKMEKASRQASQKEALLAEARDELARVLAPGEGCYTGQIIGAYKLGEVVGRGGMGEVYRGEGANRVAAIKVLHPFIMADPDQVKRFVREVELASRVRSPFVAEMYEAGTSEGGVPWVAMELLTGRDLAWHLRQTPRLSLAKVVELVDHVGQALIAIRDAGIVHRDLKPHNLMLNEVSSTRVWKVLDFGVSRPASSGGTLTRGALVGTPTYMAPEQVRMEYDVDHRADLYSLSGVIYRAITGKPAFGGEDVATILFNVVHTQPVAPSTLVKVPADVDLVIAIGMAKDREERFEKVEDLMRSLRLAVRGELDEKTRARGRALLVALPWSPTPTTT